MGESGADLPFTGFWEVRYGKRTGDDPTQKETSIGETRLQLQWEKAMEYATANVTADFLYDGVMDDPGINMENGDGWIDLREASLLFRPADFADVKAGRQVLTWGTGDLIFINDLFPKDWNAFFIGRDVEYLKAPSDTLKVSLFHETANLDLVYTPRFDADRYIDGGRISFFNSAVGMQTGRFTPVPERTRTGWFSEDELAARLYRQFGAYETALYGYHGYWKSPNGQDAKTGQVTFPRLNAYGASIRGPLLAGIGNAEIGYYDSAEDNNGTNPLIRNSEWRFLVGYEQELAQNFTGGVQYYLERMADHDVYLASLPAGMPAKEEDRHLLTLRLTRLLMNQNLTISLFNFYSPSDEDGYARVRGNYKINDFWQAELGGNLFYGENRTTFFGQFEDNSNIYVALRYGF